MNIYERATASAISESDSSTDEYKEFKSDSQLFFSDKLEESRRCSLWLIVMFIILSWNTLIYGLQLNLLVVDNLMEKIRCDIPKLAGKTNWTFEQIKAISLTKNGTDACYYYDLDYTFLSKYPYQLAYNISLTWDRDKTIKCHKFIAPGSFYHQITEVNIPCDDHEIRIPYFFTVGDLIGYTAGGFVADIYGRRIAILVALPFYAIGFFAQSLFAEYYWLMCFFGTLAHVGLTVSIVISVILLLEICNREMRSFMVIFVFIGMFVAGVLKFILAKSLCRWMQTELEMVVNCTLILPILIEWYLPESPHWLLCFKDWKRMLSVLTAMSYPKKLEINENVYRNSPSSVDPSIKYIRKTLWKPAFRRKIILGAFLHSLLYIIYNEECGKIMFVVESEAIFSLIEGISVLFNAVLIPLMLRCTTRPMSICYNLLVLGCFKCAYSMYYDYSDFGVIICCISLVISQNAIVTNGLLIMETFPTRVRGTAFGLCRTAGTIWVVIDMSLREFTNAEKVLGVYVWTIYAVFVLIAAFLCVFVSETGNVPLPDTQLQAILHF